MASDSDWGSRLWRHWLEGAVASFATLLGECFNRIRETHRRGKNASTPPRDVHRVMRLIDSIETSLTRGASVVAHADGTLELTVDICSMVELVTIHEVLTFASETHSAWRDLRDALENPRYFDHCIATLYFVNVANTCWNIPAMVLPESGTARSPDVMLRLGESGLFVEVKTREELTDGATRLDVIKAERAVKAAMRSVGGERDGQLPTGAPGGVAVAGFQIIPEDMTLLVEGFSNWFGRHRRPNVVGAFILSVDVYDARPDGATDAFPDPDVRAAVSVWFVKNNQYAGPVTIASVTAMTALKYPQAFKRWPQLLSPASST